MATIREQIKQLPDDCGVYIIKDGSGKIIYVGKSNSIRKRLYSHLRSRFAKLISKIDFIITKSELSALILEAKLIKQYLPKFNVIMRDDKSYPYLRLANAEDFPALTIERRIKPDGSEYYGPFRGGTAREIQKLLSRIFGLRKCRTSPLKKRQQPCLNYYMKRCPGPCTAKISKAAYSEKVLAVRRFMENGVDAALGSMKAEMDRASADENYEKAALIRDRIKWIEQAEGKAERGKRKGESREDMSGALVELSNILKIPYPRRIEAFDISNLGTSNTVGAMTVFIDGLPYRKHYRKFRIRYKDLPNDTAAMHEMIFRRYAKSLKDKLPLPDLILIDGGKGQLSAAKEALSQAGKEGLSIVGLAKKHEELFRPGAERPLLLPHSSSALLLLRRIRDEVHRFVITFHREQRAKGVRG